MYVDFLLVCEFWFLYSSVMCSITVLIIMFLYPPSERSETGGYTVDSAPARSLLFFVVDSVCMSVTLIQIDSSSLFLDGIEPFLGHQFSMTKTTKRFSNFDSLSWQRYLGYLCKNFKLLLLFCFPMESSHFLALSSPWTPLQNVVLRFLI